MFNDMEREVMMRIIREGLEVIYEPVIKVGLRRLIPDFQVGRTFIECTCDTQVRVKGPPPWREVQAAKRVLWICKVPIGDSSETGAQIHVLP